MPRTRSLLLNFVPRHSMWAIARTVLTLQVLQRLAKCLSMKREHPKIAASYAKVDPWILVDEARTFLGQAYLDFLKQIKKDIIRYRLRLMGVALVSISGQYRDYHWARGRYWGHFEIVTYVDSNYPGQRPQSHRFLEPWARAQRYDEISHIRRAPWHMTSLKPCLCCRPRRSRNTPYTKGI